MKLILYRLVDDVQARIAREERYGALIAALLLVTVVVCGIV